MPIKFSTSGRPMIECINPECRKLHAIYRRGDYVQRAQTRVVCRSCGTKWHLNDADTKTLQDHYTERQQEIEQKKQENKQKNDEKNQKNDEKENKQKTKNKPDEVKKEQQKRKGWLEEILS